MDDERACARKIERLAMQREQARVALRRRLVREGFSESVVDECLERACACGLVDDARYADVLVRSRISQGKGCRGIIAELEDLSIDPSEFNELNDLCENEDEELARALDMLDRKPIRAKNARDAAFRRLIQKGYATGIASRAARVWSERNLECASNS